MMRWQVPAPLLGRLGSTPAADQQTQLLWTGLRSAFKTRSWEVSFKADDLFAFSYLPTRSSASVQPDLWTTPLAMPLIDQGLCGPFLISPLPQGDLDTATCSWQAPQALPMQRRMAVLPCVGLVVMSIWPHYGGTSRMLGCMWSLAGASPLPERLVEWDRKH